MRFEFATTSKIIFGNGTVAELGPLASIFGKRALLVVGSPENQYQQIAHQIEDFGIDIWFYPVTKEPTVAIVQEGVMAAKAVGCELIISIGGGSTIDTGKAIAALLTNKGEIHDYLEVIGRGHKITQIPLPHFAVATTAGTGAEVTSNAVIGSSEHKVKVSLRSPLMFPKVAVIDPILTRSLPPEVTAATGMDALTQVLEPFVSKYANPLTDAICRDGMQIAAKALPSVYNDGDDLEARENMSLVSLYGGMALANAKLGAVHGFASVIGGIYDAPHGAICARLLPAVLEGNINALNARDPSSMILRRFDQVATFLTGDIEAKGSDAIDWIKKLCDDLNIPPLSNYGVRPDESESIINKAINSSSMKSNPVDLSPDEMWNILNDSI